MAQQTIFLGTNPNDGTGETLRGGGGIINDNFTELYALQSDTINAGAVAYNFTGATKEQRIALADADAVLLGKSTLFIPASLLPYDITLCPPSAGVQRVWEGGDFSVYDVTAYGAGFVGGDDAIPINYALTAAPRGTPVTCPVTVAGYTINSQIIVPTGGLLLGFFRGPGYTRWAETVALNSASTPGSTFFKITNTSLIPVVLRTNSRVEGIVFWYPEQNWDITSLAESFVTYNTTIQFGDASQTTVRHPVVWDCHFLGATTCIAQYSTDGTVMQSPEIGRCSGVLMGDFLRLYRVGDITRVFQCHFSSNAATNYVGDSTVGGDITVFATKCAIASTVFHLGNVDGLEVTQVFAYGAKYFAWYDSTFVGTDGSCGSFTNCNGDGVYQAFRLERGNSIFPLQIANSWFACMLRPNGVAGDSASQAFMSFATGLASVRISVANVLTFGSVSSFSAGYSGQADYVFHADGALASTANVQVAGLSVLSVNTGVVPTNLVANVWLDQFTRADVPQRRVRQRWVSLTYSATIATDAQAADCFQISATNGTAFTISNPTNATSGDEITYMIHNGSGGAMGVITWGSQFLLAGAFTNPANAFVRLITFVRRGSDWREKCRSAADQAV